jgi:hypothetical protein
MPNSDRSKNNVFAASATSTPHYQIVPQRNQARIKVRYIETNKPVIGCTLCA